MTETDIECFINAKEAISFYCMDYRKSYNSCDAYKFL